jgi:Zn-dependent peptidase ImmA (M78 family)/transcriptional regulator with XRE-family HTH domain
MQQRFNGELLNLLRKSKRFTQKDVCNNINISQGKLSKIEQGLIQPDDDFVKQLSSFFDVDISFFYQDEQCYSPANPYHRSRSTLQKGDKDMVESKANLYRIYLRKLLEAVDISHNFLPIADNTLSPTEIAKLTRRNLKLSKGPIANLTKLIEDNGIFIIIYNFNTSALDGFTILGAADVIPIIFINSTFPGERIRFTLAHELGHYIMHQTLQEKRDIETEANNFASEFLMPTDDIKPELFSLNTIKLNTSRLIQLKQKWKVSMNALLKKAIDIGAITKNQERYLWMQMAKLGFRSNEPYPLAIEEPSLLKELINIHKEQLGYSSTELASMLKISKDNYLNYFEYDKPRLRLVSTRGD